MLVTDSIKRFARNWLFLRWMAAAGAMGALVLPVSLVYVSLSTGRAILLFLLATFYVSRKVFMRQCTTQARQQLRLEYQFVRQDMDRERLCQCVQQRGHLWSASLTLQALRDVQNQPVPLLLGDAEKTRRVESHLRRAFRSMLPSPLNTDLLLALAIVGAAFFRSGAYEGFAGLLLLIPASCTALTELLQAVLQLRMQRSYNRLLESLAEWTLNHRYDAPCNSGARRYNHRLLYRSQPWFSGEAAEASPVD